MLLRRLIVAFVSVLLISFLLVYKTNTSSGFKAGLEKKLPKIARLATLSEVTKSGFENSSSFRQMLIAKASYHKFKVLISILMLGFVLFKYSKKLQKKGEKNKLYNILDKLNLIYRETDREGNILSEEVPTVTYDKESQSILVKGLNEKIIKKAIEYTSGLLQDLNSIGMIDVMEGVADTTGRPGEVKIQLMTSDLIAKSGIDSFLKSIGLYAETTLGGKKIPRYPVITEDGDDLIIDGNDIPLQIHKIKFNLNQIGITFKKDLTQVISLGKNSFKLLSRNDAPVLYSSKQREEDILDISEKQNVNKAEAEKLYLEAGKFGWISDSYAPFKQSIVDVLRQRFESTKEISWYFGALRDSLFKLPSNEIMESTEIASHIIVIGTSGSGKSEFLKTMCTSLHHAYQDNVEIYYANGTQAPDFDILTKKYSPMGMESAKPDESAKENDQLNALNTILRYAQQQANRRADLFKSMATNLNVACAKVSDYRKIVEKIHADPNTTAETKNKYPLKMTDIFIVIDEFAGISAKIDYGEKWDVEGTPARFIHRMCAENRKYGIRMVIATQECRADSIPSRLLSNIHATVIMKVKEKDIQYMLGMGYSFVGNPLEYERGSGMISAPGIIQCQVSGSQQIPILSYYLGQDAMKVYESSDYSFPIDKKMEYDLEMLSLSEKDRDFSKIDSDVLQKAIEKAFFMREGWTVLEKHNPDNFLINTYVEKEFNGELVKLRVVYTKIEPALMDGFFDRLERESSKEVDTTLYLILGKVDPKKFSEVSEKLIKHSPCIVLSSHEYSMELSKAYDYLNDNNPAPVFDTLLTQIESQKQMRIEAILKETYKDIGLKSKRIGLEICKNKLDEIINNPNAEEKGRLFEDFILLVERSLKFDTVKGIELSLENHVDFKFNKNNRNEGGLDLFRWTNREEKRGIGFQLKNQPSKALNVDIVDKIGKTIKLYSALGITFEKFVLISTGPITDQAKREAIACGYYVYGYDDLEKYFAVQDESFFLTLQEDRNVKMSNGLFSQEEMEEIYNASVEDEDKKRRETIKSDPDHKEVLSMFKTLIHQKRESKDGAVADLKKLDQTPTVNSDVKVVEVTESKQKKPKAQQPAIVLVPSNDITLKQSRNEDESDTAEESEEIDDVKSKASKELVDASHVTNEIPEAEIFSTFDLISDIKYKVTRNYLNWTSVSDWEFYKNLPSMAERKAISKIFDYVSIEEKDRVSVYIVRNERPSRKYGVELLKAITAAQKVFKTRKMKISKIEIHYVGEIDKVAIGSKVKYIQY